MSFRLIVEPDAEFDIDNALQWYNANNARVGARFLEAVDATLAAVQTNPFQYQIVYRSIRRAGLSRFPYGLMYVVQGPDIFVVACIHGRRNPRRWQRPT